MEEHYEILSLSKACVSVTVAVERDSRSLQQKLFHLHQPESSLFAILERRPKPWLILSFILDSVPVRSSEDVYKQVFDL